MCVFLLQNAINDYFSFFFFENQQPKRGTEKFYF